jgi:hypothetical protein
MFDVDIAQIDFELLGDQHRHRGVGALAHLDLRHDQRCLPVQPDANEGIGRKAIHRAGGRDTPHCWRQAEAQQQAAANGGAGFEEPATGSRRQRRGVARPLCGIAKLLEAHGRPPFTTLAWPAPPA